LSEQDEFIKPVLGLSHSDNLETTTNLEHCTAASLEAIY